MSVPAHLYSPAAYISWSPTWFSSCLLTSSSLLEESLLPGIFLSRGHQVRSCWDGYVFFVVPQTAVAWEGKGDNQSPENWASLQFSGYSRPDLSLSLASTGSSVLSVQLFHSFCFYLLFFGFHCAGSSNLLRRSFIIVGKMTKHRPPGFLLALSFV